MAWTDSRILRSFITDLLLQDVADDLNGSTPKVALYNDTPTPAVDAARTAAAYNTGQWANTAEVSHSGQWAAGGIALGSPAVTNPATGVAMFDAADTASGSAATLANVHGAFVYADAITTPIADPGISYHYFGGPQAVTNGTFTIVWAANGLFRITV